MSRILLTGVTGFIGSHLARRLVESGHSVSAITRSTSDIWRIKEIESSIDFQKADLTDMASVRKAIEACRPEFIFHLATAGVYAGKHLPDREMVDVNLMGTINLLVACSQLQYECFVNTGSSGEYGLKAEPMKESDLCRPNNIYGITKLAANLYSQMHSQINGRKVIGTRIFTPFGPYDDPSRLVTYSAWNALNGRELKLANPLTTRDYIYVEDVVDFYMECMKSPEDAGGEIFNVGTGIQTTTEEMVRKIMEISNIDARVSWNSVAPRPFDSTTWRADMKKTFSTFKWRPRHKVEDGLKKTINWFKENSDLYKKYF